MKTRKVVGDWGESRQGLVVYVGVWVNSDRQEGSTLSENDGKALGILKTLYRMHSGLLFTLKHNSLGAKAFAYLVIF